MEIWFISALVAVFFAGISNFMFKVAAKHDYHGETFTFYGGILSLGFILLCVPFIDDTLVQFNTLTALLFFGGIISAGTNIFKVQALKHIDTTIYFPLFKLLAPGLAIVAGFVIFSERFTYLEWTGMLLGLLVPLLLITKQESSRQQNLFAGLVLVGVTSVTSAIAAVIFKLGVDGGLHVVVGLFYASLGIVIGSIISSIYKYGVNNFIETTKSHTSTSLIFYGGARSILVTVSFGLILYAYKTGGTLAIVQTINSFYILIPIVLAIIVYKEHLNAQKVIAIILSVASLALLG